MGHKEDLLDGAKRCLYERGYARTTARDIVAASGTNLASIGYHFGSKDALLVTALMEAIDEWGDRLAQTLAAEGVPSGDPLTRLAAIWTRIIDSFDAHRPLWVAVFEALVQVGHSPELRRYLADAAQHGRERIVATFGDGDAAADPDRARTTGAFFQALLLGVMAQWLIDPDRAPSGHDLGAALRTLVASADAAQRVVEGDDA
ncbi:MAG: TetR/AcrR family transcriptional regulator [Gemmatimonadetes bacterium]|nr:TetR/AcrR family transcriptional regulator [Gemmatimonadota bacterium]